MERRQSLSQKIENLLNLALDATPEERQKSQELDVGYTEEDNEWELIIKYSGSLDRVRETAVSVTELLNGYAIVIVRGSRISALAGLPEVDFIEKPKSLFFETENGRRTSCIDVVQAPPLLLSGRGVLVGIVDSGIDYANPDFRNEDGTTRIAALWDQSVSGSPPEGYVLGREFTREQIDQALQETDPFVRLDLVPSRDLSGHGTAVAGIAAGNGRGSEGRRYRGAAPEAELVVVKMGTPRQGGFPRTTELMQGVDYIVRTALRLGKPVAVNISFGNTYGGHDGTTLLERYIDDVSNIWKSVFCIGTGNEAASAGHTSGRIISEGEETIQLAIQSRQSSISIQIWKEYTDQIEISIINPSGVRVGPVPEILGPHRFRIGQTEILLYYGEPSPYSISQEIYIDLLPVESYLTEGIWRIVLSAGKIVTGQYEMWLPSDNVLNRGTGFLFPTDATTLTIPSSASRAISVGAYDARTFAYADFSGRGFTRLTNMVKPDLVAPGVEVMTTTVGGGYAAFTGTSFATPFVTGSAALLMEWGIVRGNDPYLYGEKVKAYLRRGAKKVPGFDEYPNEEVGYGALCTAQSIPKI